MSILNGQVSGRRIHGTDMPFGKNLREISFTALPGCADVTTSADGTLLYAACKGELHIYSIGKDKPTEEIGVLSGLGAGRQIAVSGNILVMTARHHGAYIIDVSDPRNPQLLYHLDTLELATGVCMAENLCLITNRHMGVEVWDLSAPENPRFCSAFLGGEAQSVCVDRGFAYVGDWMNRQVHIVDITDPCVPKPVAHCHVDGFADGVFARDGILAVASGHHSMTFRNRREYENYTFVTPEMLENGYGGGHGVTFFDVSLPSQPELLSEVKFPPLFVSGNDTWRVSFSAHYAYCADTYNGVFVVDISDLLAPAFAGYYQLPAQENPRTVPPSLQRLHCPAVGLAAGFGRLYVAGVETGLHELSFESAVPVSLPGAAQPAAPGLTLKNVFANGQQIHTFAQQNDILFVAAGNGGLLALDESFRQITSILPGVVHEVIADEDFLITAEGDNGLAVYLFTPEDGIVCLSRAPLPGVSLRQVVLMYNGLVAAQGDVGTVEFFRLHEAGHLTHIKSLRCPGMLYHHHLCPGVLDNGMLCAQTLSNGPRWIEEETMDFAAINTPELKSFCPLEEGVAIKDDHIYLIRQRHYAHVTDPKDLESLTLDQMRMLPQGRLCGQPFVAGDSLILVNRADGCVEALDISSPDAPQLIGRTTLPARPEFAAQVFGKALIACGHGGIYQLG